MCERTGERALYVCRAHRRLIVARVGECDPERGVRGDAGGQWVEQRGPARHREKSWRDCKSKHNLI